MSTSEVYKHIKNLNPGLIVMLGDFHYSGHSYLSGDEFKFAIHEAFKSE